MRYMSVEDAVRNNFNLDVGNIDKTGSVRGMQRLYGWRKNGQVRIGSYIYNIGPSEVERAANLGILRG